jgi:hypothetical protein
MLSKSGFVLAFSALAIVAQAADFTPNVVLLNLQGKQMPDPEFDEVGHQVTWQDELERLWVAPVNPENGDITITQAKMLATKLAPNAPVSSGNATGNGPEWVYTGTGSEILYTIQNGKLGPQNWRVGRARKVGNNWVAGPWGSSTGVVGGAPDGTKVSTGDSDPLVNYYYAVGRDGRGLSWAKLNDSSQKGVVPFEFAAPARWIPEGKVFISAVQGKKVHQAVFYDPAQPNTYQQLTFDDAFGKLDLRAWNAPELGGELVFFALEAPKKSRDGTQIGFYRKINGSWTKTKTIRPPAGKKFKTIFSPELFLYEGKSYIVMTMMGSNPKTQGTETWIAGIESQDFYRKVAGPENGVQSTDPEAYVTPHGAFIYLAQDGGKKVFRAATGL